MEQKHTFCATERLTSYRQQSQNLFLHVIFTVVLQLCSFLNIYTVNLRLRKQNLLDL